MWGGGGGMTLGRPLFKGCCTVYIYVLYTIQRSHRVTWDITPKFTEMIVTLNCKDELFSFFHCNLNITSYKEIRLFAMPSMEFSSLVVCFNLKMQAVINKWLLYFLSENVKILRWMPTNYKLAISVHFTMYSTSVQFRSSSLYCAHKTHGKNSSYFMEMLKPPKNKKEVYKSFKKSSKTSL